MNFKTKITDHVISNILPVTTEIEHHYTSNIQWPVYTAQVRFHTYRQSQQGTCDVQIL